MNISDGFLTSILLNFQDVFMVGGVELQKHAIRLMGLLCGLEIIRCHLFNLEEGNHLNILLKNAVRFGIFLYFVKYYTEVSEAIIDSFIKVGLIVGGNQIDIATAKNPSLVFDIGLGLVKNILSFIKTEVGSIWNVISGPLSAVNLLPTICFLIAMLLILVAFLIIALQIFVTFLELYILLALVPILIPWGIFRYTAFIAEKAYGAIVAIGVKVMVLTCILSVTIPLVQGWTSPTLTGADVWSVAVQMAAGALVVALLTWLAPSMASSLISGSPNLSAGSVAGTAMAGVGMGVAAAKTVMSGTKTIGNIFK